MVQEDYKATPSPSPLHRRPDDRDSPLVRRRAGELYAKPKSKALSRPAIVLTARDEGSSSGRRRPSGKRRVRRVRSTRHSARGGAGSEDDHHRRRDRRRGGSGRQRRNAPSPAGGDHRRKRRRRRRGDAPDEEDGADNDALEDTARSTGPLLARSKAKSKPMRPQPPQEAPGEEPEPGAETDVEPSELLDGEEELVEGEEEEEDVDARDQDEQEGMSQVADGEEFGDVEEDAELSEQQRLDGAEQEDGCSLEEPSLSSPEGSQDDPPPMSAPVNERAHHRRHKSGVADANVEGHRKRRRRHRHDDSAEAAKAAMDATAPLEPEAKPPPEAEDREDEDKLRPATINILRELVTQIYAECNPTKLAEVDVLFAKYAGMEFAMYERICEKYGRHAETLAMIKARHQAAGQRGAGSGKKAAPSASTQPPSAAEGRRLDGKSSGWPFTGEPFSPNSVSSDESVSPVVDPYAGLAPDPVWKQTDANRPFVPPAGMPPYGAPPGMPPNPYWPPPPGWPPGAPPGYPPNGWNYGHGGAARPAEKIDLPHLLGDWRDSSGHDVKVEWASSSSSKTGALLDVQLRQPPDSKSAHLEPIRLHVKRVEGRLVCGSYDLDLGKSSYQRVVWTDFKASGKESTWERVQK